VEVRLGFRMSSYQCREVRVYFYSAVDPVLNVWEELFCYGSLIAPLPFFLPFQCGFFKFTVKGGLGKSVEDDWHIFVASCFFGYAVNQFFTKGTCVGLDPRELNCPFSISEVS